MQTIHATRRAFAPALFILVSLDLAAAPANAQQTLYAANVGNDTIEKFDSNGTGSVRQHRSD